MLKPLTVWITMNWKILEEISSIFLSIVFLYFFALITEEGSLSLLAIFGTLHSNETIGPDDTTLMTESRGTKEPLDEGERGERKSCLKTQHSKNKDHGIQYHHFMANRWGEMETFSILK